MAGKGDGNVRYFEMVDEEPYLHYLTEFRSSQSQKGVGWLPKTACDVNKCEIARCFRLLRDCIVPISLQVPRKSDMFQNDIFPDTYAGVPMLTADEWLGGADAAPQMRSMKPGAAGGAVAVAAPVFAAKKTAQQLQEELDTAYARIAALEAELAAVSFFFLSCLCFFYVFSRNFSLTLFSSFVSSFFSVSEISNGYMCWFLSVLSFYMYVMRVMISCAVWL